MPNTIPLWSAVQTPLGLGFVIGYIANRGAIEKYLVTFDHIKRAHTPCLAPLTGFDFVPAELTIIYPEENVNAIL